MSRFTIQTDLGRIEDLKTLIKYTAQCIQQINNILNGNIEFDSNLMTQTVKVTFVTANVGQLVTHGMNRTGLRYFVIDKTVNCDVTHTAALDNASQIYLTCNVATTVTIILL